MQLEILTPDQKVFEGEASRVQFPGIDGKFEVLNNHAAMIAALGNGNLKITADKGVENLNIKGGFVEVLNNRVVVLIEGMA